MARTISLRDLDGAWAGPRLDLGEASDGQQVACKVPWWVTHLLADVAREGRDGQPAPLRRWPARPGTDDAAPAGLPVPLAMGANDVWVDLPPGGPPPTGTAPADGGAPAPLLLQAERDEPLRYWLPCTGGYLLSELSVLLLMAGLCAALCWRASCAVAVPLLSTIPVARLCPELPLLFSPRCLRAPSWFQRSRHTLITAARCVAAVSALLLLAHAARGDFGAPAAWWPLAPSPAGRAGPAEPAWSLEPTAPPRVDCAGLAGVDCSARLAAWAGPGACAVLAQTEGTCASFCSRMGRTCRRAMDDVGTGECAVDEGGHGRQRAEDDGCLQDWHTQICACGGRLGEASLGREERTPLREPAPAPVAGPTGARSQPDGEECRDDAAWRDPDGDGCEVYAESVERRQMSVQEACIYGGAAARQHCRRTCGACAGAPKAPPTVSAAPPKPAPPAPAPTPPPRQPSIDCGAGLLDWKTSWSDDKKAWCCQRRGLGCTGFESDEACFVLEAKYEPLNMPGQRGTHAATLHDCQKRCRRSPGCARFTWFVHRQRCHLQESASTLMPSDGSVAGPADCELEAEMMRDGERLAGEGGGGPERPLPRHAEEPQSLGRPRLAGGSLPAVFAVLATAAAVAANRAI